ncbi:MAG: tyrosine-type recombinase/integrase [Nitrososphaeria archaeon]
MPEDQIYYYDRRLRNALTLLEKSTMLKEDRDVVKGFIEHLESQGVSVGRLAKYVFHLKVFGEELGKPFKEASRRDLERFMIEARSRYAPKTVEDYGLVVKRFYKFLYFGNVDKDTPFPDLVRWIKKSGKLSEMGVPEFFTGQEVQAMVEASDCLRDRAMLAVGYEAGLRASELLGMNVGDVSFDSLGARVKVKGKTGERVVRLITSAPMLAKYMEVHPFRGQFEKPLWPSHATNYRGKRLSWSSWNRILKEAAVKAGIKKRVHNHMLRHGSATEAAKFLTEHEMKVKYGWTGGSRMPAVYVHLSSRDLDEKLARVYAGRQLEPVKPDFSPILCPKCGEKNSPGQKFCGRCGTPLDKLEIERSSVEIEELKREVRELKDLLLKLGQKPL